MTYYDWICDDCCLLWEQDHPLGTAPKQTECPECGELRNRNWGSVTTFAMKGDCHTNRMRQRNYWEKGMDKDTAEEYYAGAIKNTKAGIATGWQHYSKMTPNIKKGKELGLISERSDKESKDAMNFSKKLTENVYNDLGRDMKQSLQKPQ